MRRVNREARRRHCRGGEANSALNAVARTVARWARGSQPVSQRQQLARQRAADATLDPQRPDGPGERQALELRPLHAKACQFLLFGLESLTAVVPVAQGQDHQNDQTQEHKYKVHHVHYPFTNGPPTTEPI